MKMKIGLLLKRFWNDISKIIPKSRHVKFLFIVCGNVDACYAISSQQDCDSSPMSAMRNLLSLMTRALSALSSTPVG